MRSGASTTAAIGMAASAGAASITAAIGMVSSMTAAMGIGSAEAAGTALKSDLHCSQNNAPSSLAKEQKGHFVMAS